MRGRGRLELVHRHEGEGDDAPLGERERLTRRRGDLVGKRRNIRGLVGSLGSGMKRICGNRVSFFTTKNIFVVKWTWFFFAKKIYFCCSLK